MSEAQTDPVFILVEPQMGENIGAAARAMWNFALEDMRIVDPRDGWPNDAAVAMSSGATHILDNAQLHPTTREAVADCHHVYATTARPRELTKRVLTPEAAALEMRQRAARGERSAVLFGRERSGLGKEDVALANSIVTVPVNPKFHSLNLAQCVLLMGYEWLRAADATPAEVYDPGPMGMANHRQISQFVDFVEAELEEMRFFWPEAKAPSMRLALRNLYHRAPLTDADLRILWGSTRVLSDRRRRSPKGVEPNQE